ncbi:outer membrane protein assembly factor BamD [Hydrogenivirga sp. 128-5-R1-1]|uniref:outer membrane protein assembly factor BamD n=1 Tax=Hydrogenivirga sp. 128-5-R1-1 TaxID=392423 RepID=UPI001E5A8580|nr:outer membrane protein assembly factor BamD [Hydrogenivirga sp. 128-5-R1-1]
MMGKLSFLLVLFLLLSGCAKITEEERAKKAQEYYREALSAYKEKDYGDAAWNFNEALKYMDYLTPKQIENAKFLLAKSYYYDGDYVNAVVALEDYIFYYPKLRRTEEAFYLLIDSYINVSPDPYRDQEYTWKAIEKAKEFLSRFPNSTFAPKVQKLIDKAYRKIAQHELYIAKFYEDYGYTYSAALRYREVLINFPGHVSESEVAYRYIRCLLLTDRQIEIERDKISNLIDATKDKLEDAENEEERKAIKRRLEFLKSELKRWEKIGEEAKREAVEALAKYREVYGENAYYRELRKLVEGKEWKS